MKLSIITINYNDIVGLKKTIESILIQTWRDFEWIVIDGGSTDGSREVLEKYKEHFSYWCSEPDQGIYNAINKGLLHAKGDYINCMNAGDTFYAPDTLEKVFHTPHNVDIIYGDWMQVYPEEQYVMHEPYPIDLHAFLHQNICHQAMFVKTNILKNKGFDESYKLLADYARWTELFLQNASVTYVNCIVCRYDMSGVSNNSSKLCKAENKRILEELIPMCLHPMLIDLDYYTSICAFDRLKLLLNNGGIQSKIVRAFLKLMDKIFLQYNFRNQRKTNFRRFN